MGGFLALRTDSNFCARSNSSWSFQGWPISSMPMRMPRGAEGVSGLNPAI